MFKVSNSITKKVLLIAQLILAIVFIFSGLVKANDPMGMQYKVEDYLVAWNMNDVFSTFTIRCFVVILSALEFTLGLALIMKQRWSVFGAIILLLFLTPITLWLWMTNAISDCGCFGDVIVLTTGQTLIKNIVLLLLSLMLIKASKKWKRNKHQTIYKTIGISCISIVLLALFSIYHLPTIDFTPYKVGADINKINNFFIESETKGDITQEVSTDTAYTYFLVAPYLEISEKSNMNTYNSLYKDCLSKGIAFYCLTASAQQAREQWKKETNSKYPFLFADDIELKTMVRSNPGLVIIKNGHIVAKYSFYRIPKKFDNI